LSLVWLVNKEMNKAALDQVSFYENCDILSEAQPMIQSKISIQ